METDTARALPSHGIFTCALPDGLRYVSAGDLRDSFLAEPVIRIEAIERKLDTLLETDDSSAIENFREILGFLEGLTDDERLAARLADIGRRLDGLSDTISSKQDALETSPDLMLTDGHILSLTDLAKVHLFCDLFNQAAGEHGHAEVVDGVFSCMLNGLELTYGEAVEIYMAGPITSSDCRGRYYQSSIRTNLPSPLKGGNWGQGGAFDHSSTALCDNCPDIEVLDITQRAGGIVVSYSPNNWVVGFCPKLRKILGHLDLGKVNNPKSSWGKSPLWELPELVDVELYMLGAPINLSTCPKLSLESYQYCVKNARTMTETVPITVHPDVYAKLTGDTTNEAAAALTEEELAKWAQLLSDAAEKEITFTIPN